MKPADGSAEQLVDSGIALMIADPQQLLERGLNIERAFQRAQVSRATFYRRFPTKQRFLDEVVEDLIKTSRLAPAAVSAVVQQAWTTCRPDVRRFVQTLADNYSDVATSHDNITRQLLAVLFGRTSAQGRRAVSASYESRDAAVRDALETVLSETGATVHKPFTTQSFGTVITAVVDGMLLRQHVDPDAVPEGLLSDVILAVTNAVLSASHDHRHLYGTLDALAPKSVATTVPRDPRAALIDAARDEFGRCGYFPARYESIAANAGVNLHTARRLFPTKTHIIAGALRSHYEKLRTAIDDDTLIGLDEVAILHHHFARCAQLVADETALMDALILAVAHDTYSEPDGMLAIKKEINIPGLIVPVIEAGQRNRLFTASYSAQELGAMLTNSLLLRCFTRRHLSPEENATFASEVLLGGIRLG
ncbi:TetR/AcrR family transcriptional regulator [Skermania sp. ID1734]|uniref:TetR/AcrR family transcriptional regulator n=1 Tax=Skermania sp. ID1734 TaxID=2597516 RepID=UPI00117D1BD8|nr:TetR/AcrR family transcriptional regulator [Skermania sp. ID1734]TSE00618.1 TetR/AcrR family transcriptional regulator [Skermania sp. ID1734]